MINEKNIFIAPLNKITYIDICSKYFLVNLFFKFFLLNKFCRDKDKEK